MPMLSMKLTNSAVEYAWVWAREHRLKAYTVAGCQAEVFTAFLSNSFSDWHCTDAPRLHLHRQQWRLSRNKI